MSTGLTQAEMLRRVIESQLVDLHTSLPCRVQSYDAETQTADLVPVVRRAIRGSSGDIVHEDLPVIPNVPIAFPRGGGTAITWPIVKGDHVLVIFQESATSQWRETGDVSDPGDLRRHGLGDAFAIPGVAPNAGALAQAQDAALVIEAPEIKLGDGAAFFVALENLVATRLTELATAITTATIAIGAGGAADVGVKLAAAGWSGGGVIPPSVAATKVKAE